jgi:hypothetical protein
MLNEFIAFLKRKLVLSDWDENSSLRNLKLQLE